MMTRSAAILVTLVVLATGFSGCATAGPVGTSRGAPSADGGENTARQMIISSAFMALEVDDVERAAEAIVAAAKKHDGYVVTSGKRTVVRVEVGSFAAALRDVARQYSDTSLRLQNAKSARERYLELLARAENVEAALKVERELERLNGEITILESTLGNLAHLVRYATINVTLTGRVKPGPLGWVFSGLHKAVEWLFVWC